MKFAYMYTGDYVNRHSYDMITLGRLGGVADEITIVPNKKNNTGQQIQ